MSPFLSQRRMAIVSISFVIVLIYLFFIAVKLYRSEASFVVRDVATSHSSAGVDLSIFGISTGAQTGYQDTYHVIEYLRSIEVLTDLDAHFHLRDRYSSSNTDILQRLWSWSTIEDFLELYRKHLTLTYDSTTNITYISFDCSDSAMSQQIVSFLLLKGTHFLNHQNQELAKAKLQVAQGIIEQSKEKMDAAIAAVERFQAEYNVVDPQSDIATQTGIVAHLEGQLVEKTNQLNQLMAYLNQDAFEIVNLRQQIAEIKDSLKRVRSRMTGRNQNRLNELAFQFARLKAAADFASTSYQQTVIQFEIAKLDIQKESKILETITRPSRPQGYIYPNRPNIAVTALFLIFAITKILQLLWAVIQDHKD